MYPVQFPIKDGVEVRTMGQCLRPLRLYFRRTDKQDGFQLLQGPILVVDDEQKAFQIVHEVKQILFDHDAMPNNIGGRIFRITDDTIETVKEGKFEGGYLRNVGTAQRRLVSEPFMLMSSDSVDEAKFNELHEKASANFARDNARATTGSWD